jgi:hypothetical protein
MTNEEIMRPCTWGGKLFDAYQNLNIIEGGIDSSLTYYKTLSYSDVKIIDNDGYLIVSKKCASAEKEDVLKVKMEAITAIADALNAPVLATEEVLAGLPKDASFWLCWKNQKIKARYDYDRCDEDSYKWIFESVHHDRHYMADSVYEFDGSFTVEADKDDPKTAEYLRQFTLDGVRRVGV